MKYSEFIKMAEKHRYKTKSEGALLIAERTSGVIEKNVIAVSRSLLDRVWPEIKTCDYHDIAVIKAAIELTETHPKEREDEKRYIVPLPHLKTSDGAQQYLTHRDGTFFASRIDENLRQTWKEKDLVYIPEEYRKYAEEIKK